MSKPFNEKLIAPCGMNCGICAAYLREKNKCPGCRFTDDGKPNSCVKCRIKNCDNFKNTKAKYCLQCKKFPCNKLSHLDTRYRGKYHMSEIENLISIRDDGMKNFLANQEKTWKCSKCGGAISCHNGLCYSCELDKLKNKKRKYSWEN